MNDDLKNYVMPSGIYKNTRANSLCIKRKFPFVYENIKDNYHTKLYMLLHDITEIPKCKNPNCNNKVKLKNIGAGFRKYCCNKCIAEHQKIDERFSNKISVTKLKKSKEYFKNKYPELEFSYDKSNKNYYIIKNYCKHGDIRIYSNVFKKLYENNKCLCIKCNEENVKNYIPNEEEINKFQNEFQSFYKKYSLAFKDIWFLTYFPKEYKIILYWSKHIKDISLTERIYLFKNNLKEIPKCKNPNCNHKVHFNHSNLSYTHFCNSPACLKNTSSLELEILSFLESLNPNTKSKFYISKNEYDIIVDNLLVEFNGLYWHGDLIKNDKNYHYNKYLLAKQNEFDFFNIWEDDWHFRKDIIKSMLSYKINKTKNNINARECEIKLVRNIKNFLNENHLQGWCQSSINLGLFYKNELISCTTFGKRKIGGLEQFELLRFCSKLNTNVVGGASKLFSYFIKNYKPKKIISYASCDYSGGNLYRVLGFNEVGHTGINYWWSDNDKRYHRSNFMKYKLVREGFNPNKSENEIMRERGFYKIYGTGNLKYEFIS
jgi:hypothetical protein